MQTIKGIEPQPPKALGFFQKFTDFFNDIFYGYKPNQEKYDSELRMYNTFKGIQQAESTLNNKLKALKTEDDKQVEEVQEKANEKTAGKKLDNTKELTDIPQKNTDKEPVSLDKSEIANDQIIIDIVRKYNVEHKNDPVKPDKDVMKELTYFESPAKNNEDIKIEKEVQHSTSKAPKTEAVLK